MIVDVVVVVAAVVLDVQRGIGKNGRKKRWTACCQCLLGIFFSLSEGNITINENDMQIVFVVVRRRGKCD